MTKQELKHIEVALKKGVEYKVFILKPLERIGSRVVYGNPPFKLSNEDFIVWVQNLNNSDT